MKRIKIFLASSNELKQDREKFEIEIYRKCKTWFDQEIFLHLDVWEDLSARISDTRSQDEYNEKIKQVDIFVLLAHSKVGMCTAEEFDQAFGSFTNTKKPFIFTYFKKVEKNSDSSLKQFKEKLHELGHFYSQYADHNDLWNQFNKELERMEVAEFKRNDHDKARTGRNVTMGDKGVYIEKAKDIKINLK